MNTKRIIQGLFIPALFTVIPTAFHPELIYRVESWICYLIGVCLILTQPAFSYNLISQDYKTQEDHRSAFFLHLTIFSICLISVIYFLFKPSPLSSSIRNISLIIGMLIAGTGLTIRIWSIRTLGKFFTATVQIFEDHQLIQIGPYRFIRHPSYTGAILATIAPVIIYAAWIFLIPLSICLCAAYSYRVKIEEKALVEKFGDKYTDYQKIAGTYLPRI